MRATPVWKPIGRRRELAATALLAAAIAAPPAARAVDGVIQINQARALAGGVVPGDSPGFPVMLSLAGSYRLTGSLDVTGQAGPANVTAIEITVAGVSLDLNGFSLIGPTVCTGSPVSSCAPTGSGRGIDAAGIGTTVVNGSVFGFGDDGIFLASGTVERVQAFSNGGIGIRLMTSGLVLDSAAVANGDDGISGPYLQVRGSRALENGGRGIATTLGEIRDSEAVRNEGAGIDGGAGLVSQSLSRDNGGCQVAASAGAYGRNVVFGTTTLCGGAEFGTNLCNGTVCP